jgi:presenilin-like A22 family membrane protease
MSGLRDVAPFVGMAALFLAVELLAIAFVPSFEAAGLQATENAQDPTNSVLYFGAILVFTAFLLGAVRLGYDIVLRAVIIGSVGVLCFYALSALVPVVGAAAGGVVVAGLVAVYPEWYVVDTAGVLMGAAGAGIFGISFGVVPALLLLVVLAVYDAVAVYRTEHMLTLADGVMDLKLPVMFVVPRRPGYSFVEDTEEVTEGDESDALFMGLGDAVIPGVLVASAAHFVGYGPAAGALVGALVGFVALMRKVAEGEPHAGLPLLNGGAIAGFFIGAYVFGVTPFEAVGL